MRQNKGRELGLLLAFILLLAAGCSGEKDRDQAAVERAIADEVERRLVEYKRIRLEDCQKAVMQEASRRADSILIARARLEKDTFMKPPKPLKPEKPTLKQLDDTLELKPILRDSE